MERWKVSQIHWVPCPFEGKPILERVGASVNEFTRDLANSSIVANQIPSDSVELVGNSKTLSIGAKGKERMSCTSRLRQGQRKVYFAEEMMLLVVASCFAPKLNPGHSFSLFRGDQEMSCVWLILTVVSYR